MIRVRIVLIAFAVLILSLSVAPPALAIADGPDAWRVVGVGSDDVLNVRAGPAVDYPVIATLPYNARGLQMVVCIPTLRAEQYFNLTEEQQIALAALARWCAVSDGVDTLGWVNARYLAEDF